MARLKRVYCFQVASEDCYKIGLTKNTPKKRARGLANRLAFEADGVQNSLEGDSE
jgi:hypothetical protein